MEKGISHLFLFNLTHFLQLLSTLFSHVEFQDFVLRRQGKQNQNNHSIVTCTLLPLEVILAFAVPILIDHSYNEQGHSPVSYLESVGRTKQCSSEGQLTLKHEALLSN